MKHHFRKNNDQSTNEPIVKNRIIEARVEYAKSDIKFRFFRRFWRITESYSKGNTYAMIMKECFNAGTEIKSHRKIIRNNDD